MTDELTAQDKASLVGYLDEKNADDYDRDFYEAMWQNEPPDLDELDDRVRQAIMRFIKHGKGMTEIGGGFLLAGFLHGYMVGRKLKRDIRRKGESRSMQ